MPLVILYTGKLMSLIILVGFSTLHMLAGLHRLSRGKNPMGESFKNPDSAQVALCFGLLKFAAADYGLRWEKESV
jgi:hypothetical protein